MFIPERSRAWGDVQVADALIGRTSVKYYLCWAEGKEQQTEHTIPALGSGAGKPENRHLKSHSTIVD